MAGGTPSGQFDSSTRDDLLRLKLSLSPHVKIEPDLSYLLSCPDCATVLIVPVVLSEPALGGAGEEKYREL
jgi:hypothetical protein